MARYNVDLQDDKGNAYQTMANPDSVAEFSPASSRENIKSGETHRVIFGKIMKYLSEVGNAAYVGLANNCTTTVEGFALDARQGKELMDRINELNRDFAGGQMEIRLTEAGKGEYRKKGADTWIPFRSEIRIINIFLPPHRDNWGHMDIDVSDYSTLSIGSVTTSGGHTAEIMGDDVLIGSYKHGDKNIILNISDVKKLRFRNSLKTTDFSRYVDFGNVTIS